MSHFISINELQNQVGKVVIFDCRFNLANKTQGYEQYRNGHIPGAYYLDLEKDLSSSVTLHGGRHPLPDAELFSKKMRECGVNQQSVIVVYDDSRMAYSARAWWLLRYFGHQQVVILDGGFSAWLNSGGNLDRRAPALKSGNFKANIQSDWTCDRDDILQNSQSILLIDSRETKRYRGEEEPIDPIAGHIPGAVNYFWQDATTDKGFIKTNAEQQERWKNLSTNENLVVYCGSGVTACVNLLSLSLCGINAKLYPGSWSDWCSYSDSSVETCETKE